MPSLLEHFRRPPLVLKRGSITARLCMNRLGNYLNEPQHIRILRIGQGIDPNTRRGQQMRNSHKVRMDNGLNIS